MEKREQITNIHCRFLRRSFAAQAFITCSRKGNWRGAHKADKNGLVQGHAYTITGIFRVDLKQQNGRAPRCQFHQHFTRGFFIRNFLAQLFCTYILG
jgi:hypothetical protein